MSKKPRGYWTKENTIKEAQKVAKELNTEYLPTQKEMRKFSRSLDVYVTKLFGSRFEFAKAAGLKLRQSQMSHEKAKNSKDFAYIKEQIYSIMESLNIERMPTKKEIDAYKDGLYAAIVSHHGGIGGVAKSMGLTSSRKPLGYWKVIDNVAIEIQKWGEDHEYDEGIMPSSRELFESGAHSLMLSILRYHEGFYATAQKLKLKMSHSVMPPGYWEDFEKVATAVKEIAENNGTPNIMPTYEELGSPLIHACNRHHDGFKNVAERLGLLIVRSHTSSEIKRLMSPVSGLKETMLYAFRAKSDSRYSKIGITYDYKSRKRDDDIGVYPDKPDWFNFYSRRTAWAIEQRILRDTINNHPGALELAEWQGWSELRTVESLRFDLLDDYTSHLESEIDAVGWKEYVLENQFLLPGDFEDYEEDLAS